MVPRYYLDTQLLKYPDTHQLPVWLKLPALHLPFSHHLLKGKVAWIMLWQQEFFSSVQVWDLFTVMYTISTLYVFIFIIGRYLVYFLWFFPEWYFALSLLFLCAYTAITFPSCYWALIMFTSLLLCHLLPLTMAHMFVFVVEPWFIQDFLIPSCLSRLKMNSYYHKQI